MLAGLFPRSWQDGAASVAILAAVFAALVRIVRGGRSFGHRIDKILHKVEGLDEVKLASEQAKLASEQATEASNRASMAASEARDEWRGATQAIREMADGHGGLLKSHADQLIDHEARISKLEGGTYG